MSDHTEALQVDFDRDIIRYEDLLERIWKAHDPTRRHFSRQYMAAIWTHDDDQLAVARETGDRAAAGELVTRIDPIERFYRAEDYHQKYRLRKERDLTAALIARYGSDRAMVDSTEAARLNGHLRGYPLAEQDRELLRGTLGADEGRVAVVSR